MNRIGAHSLRIVLGFSLATFATVSHADPGGRIWLAAEPSQDLPSCEEFYDKWEAPGAPVDILAMAGLGREVVAARDCVAKSKIPLACKHWQGLLVVIDKLGPPLNESRGDIEELMRQHDCQSAANAGANPAPQAAPGGDPAVDVEANPAPAMSDLPAETPAADK